MTDDMDDYEPCFLCVHAVSYGPKKTRTVLQVLEFLTVEFFFSQITYEVISNTAQNKITRNWTQMTHTSDLVSTKKVWCVNSQTQREDAKKKEWGGDKEEEQVIHPYRVGVTFCGQLWNSTVEECRHAHRHTQNWYTNALHTNALISKKVEK